MNNYIGRRAILTITDDSEETRAEQMLFTVLCFIFICLSILMGINLFSYIFYGIDEFNLILKDIPNMVIDSFNYVSPSHIFDRIEQLF